MKMRIRQLMFVVAAVAMLCGSISNVQAADDRSYLMATASTGGTYYPVGVALSTLIKVKLQPNPEDRHVGHQLGRFRRKHQAAAR